MIKHISLQERCDSYERTFPKYPVPVVGKDGRMQGIWFLGQNYRSKNKFYGEYPPNYLKRVYSLFPDILNDKKSNILHLFSGSLKKEDMTPNMFRLDTKPKILLEDGSSVEADFVANAEIFSESVSQKFDLIFADPPYSDEDAKRYGTPMVSRNKVVKQCYNVLNPRGYLVWLDQVLPMYRRTEFNIVGAIGLMRSTNHRFRLITIFQKTLTSLEEFT